MLLNFIYSIFSKMNFKEVQLYGGAIKTKIPQTFADVSRFNVIPDNQEVYEDMQSECKIIIELLERDYCVSDTDCGAHYFQNIVQENHAEEAHIISTQKLSQQVSWTEESRNRGIDESFWTNFRDILSQTGQQLERKDLAAFPEGPCIPIPVLTCVACVAGRQVITRLKQKHNVLVNLCVIRLANPINTDILVTAYSPESIGESNEQNVLFKSSEEIRAVMETMLKSFEIQNWSLFCISENKE